MVHRNRVEVTGDDDAVLTSQMRTSDNSVTVAGQLEVGKTVERHVNRVGERCFVT